MKERVKKFRANFIFEIPEKELPGFTVNLNDWAARMAGHYGQKVTPGNFEDLGFHDVQEKIAKPRLNE